MPRLLAETAGVLLAAEVAEQLVLPVILPMPDGLAGALVHAGALALVAAPLVLWRVRKTEASQSVRTLLSTFQDHAILSVADARGRIVEVNDRFCAISGYARHELIGQDHRLLASGEHDKEFWRGVWANLSVGRVWRGEFCNRAKNGSLFWVDSILVPIMGSGGKVQRFVSILTDVTERVRSERMVRASERVSTALLGSFDIEDACETACRALGQAAALTKVAVLLFDEAGACRFVASEGLSERYIKAVEGLNDGRGHCPWCRGQREASTIACDDVMSEASLAGFHGMFASEGIRSLAFVPVMGAGGVAGKLMLYSEVPGGVGSLQVSLAGAIAATLGAVLGRVAFSQELARNEARFRQMVETADVIVWEYDAPTNRFTYVSPQAGRLGYPIEDWYVPGFWQSTIHEDDRAAAVTFCTKEFAAGRAHRFQYRMRCADGRIVWIDDVVSVECRSATPTTMRGVLVDVTELRETREKAEAANRAKSEFLANVSHEIRTPLTAILGYADMLRDEEELTPTQRGETLGAVRSAGRHLLALINDILDLSKIEAERMEVERVETSLVAALRDVEQVHRTLALRKRLALSVEFGSQVPERVMGDPTRLRQVLLNLVGNAVKFTDKGAVTIRVHADPGAARLTIDVQDTGVGLGPRSVERLFQSFGQADQSVTRRHGGTGLGLAISRRLARLMGGEVTLHSTRPGAGSCFRLSLPLEVVEGTVWTARPAALEAPAEPRVVSGGSASLRGRILLAEDGPDNQRLLAFHLRRAGATVEIAENGVVALRKIEEAAAAGEAFDLLLSDMQMPEMDGYALAEALRARGFAGPIIALTAHAMAEDRERCLRAGCDGYATKPIDRDALLEMCAAWMGKKSGERRASAA